MLDMQSTFWETKLDKFNGSGATLLFISETRAAMPSVPYTQQRKHTLPDVQGPGQSANSSSGWGIRGYCKFVDGGPKNCREPGTQYELVT